MCPQAEGILRFLVKMHQDYLKDGLSVSGAGYNAPMVLWHKHANRPLTYPEKMSLFLELYPPMAPQ